MLGGGPTAGAGAVLVTVRVGAEGVVLVAGVELPVAEAVNDPGSTPGRPLADAPGGGAVAVAPGLASPLVVLGSGRVLGVLRSGPPVGGDADGPDGAVGVPVALIGTEVPPVRVVAPVAVAVLDPEQPAPSTSAPATTSANIPDDGIGTEALPVPPVPPVPPARGARRAGPTMQRTVRRFTALLESTATVRLMCPDRSGLLQRR